MSELSVKSCAPCRGGVPALRGIELVELRHKLGGDWRVVGDHHLEKQFQFDSFRKNIEFVNRVAEVAELEGHHPNIAIDYKKSVVTIWTHKIDGLTESDFILAAKIDRV